MLTADISDFMAALVFPVPFTWKRMCVKKNKIVGLVVSKSDLCQNRDVNNSRISDKC